MGLFTRKPSRLRRVRNGVGGAVKVSGNVASHVVGIYLLAAATVSLFGIVSAGIGKVADKLKNIKPESEKTPKKQAKPEPAKA